VADRRAGAVTQCEDVRRLFDAKAATWAAKYAPGGRLAGRLGLMLAAIGGCAPPGGRVLDIGCGTGELARAMAVTGLTVAGCDISGGMLRHAARHRGRPAGLVRLDPCWRRLPFRAASFDAVVAASVLEYVEDPAIVLGECARVLRPGGTLLCTVPDPAHPLRWLEWLARWVLRGSLARAVARCWPRMDRYLRYLGVSRHRRLADWWYATAAGEGLQAVTGTDLGERRRSPLRLLTFAKPGASAR
jgi:SAM-dependent methyltransferase